MQHGDEYSELTPIEASLVGDVRSTTRLHARLSYIALGLAPLVRRYRVVIGTDVVARDGFDVGAVAHALATRLEETGGWVPAVCLLMTPVSGPEGAAHLPEPSAVADLVAGDRTVVCAYDLTDAVDCDAVTANLAVELGARHLLLLSDVAVVHRTGATGSEVVRTLCADDAAAAIGTPPEAASVLAGRAGTTITPSAPVLTGGVA